MGAKISYFDDLGYTQFDPQGVHKKRLNPMVAAVLT
jgi:hypothetical protein